MKMTLQEFIDFFKDGCNTPIYWLSYPLPFKNCNKLLFEKGVGMIFIIEAKGARIKFTCDGSTFIVNLQHNTRFTENVLVITASYRVTKTSGPPDFLCLFSKDKIPREKGDRLLKKYT